MGIDASVRDFVDGIDDIFNKTGAGRVVDRVYMRMVDLMAGDKETYEDLYNLFYRSIKD